MTLLNLRELVREQAQIMSDPHEVELKLELSPADAVRLRDRICNHSYGEGVKQRLVSVYFDTPKRALREQGLSLRVRSDGDRYVQTVKSADTASAGLFDRREWETEIDSDVPDLKVAAHTPVGDVLKGKRALKSLAPVFQTVMDRTTWRIAQDEFEIEVALDEGEVIINGAARAITELELELKRGSPADLFAFVRNLDAAESLRIGVLAKSERGYALADDDEPHSFKAAAISLKPGASTADAFRTIVHACIRQFRLNEPLMIASRSAEPLHQARVAMRRLRSALSLFKPIVADEHYELLKDRLREVSGHLGKARNLDVYISRMAVSNADASGGPAAPSARDVDRVRAERERAYDRVIEMLESDQVRSFILDLVAWVEAGSWRTSGDRKTRAKRDQGFEVHSRHVLDRQRRKVKKRGRHLDRLSPEDRHRVRIEAKKLRYACEFFASLAGDRKHRKRHKAFTGAVANLQADLGDLNDIETGDEVARELGLAETALAAERATTDHTDMLEERTASLVSSACAAHHRLSKAKRFWKS